MGKQKDDEYLNIIARMVDEPLYVGPVAHLGHLE